MSNATIDKSLSEEECKKVCECAFDNNLKKMQVIYENKIAVAVLTQNLRRAYLLGRDLVVIKKLAGENC